MGQVQPREDLPDTAVAAPLLDLRARVWFNEDLESRNYIIPGIIAVVMGLIAALLTSLTIAREWERGTMEQLISTPVKPVELMVGKLLPYFFIGMVDVLIALLMALFLFHVPLRGSIPLLLVVSACFIVGTLAPPQAPPHVARRHTCRAKMVTAASPSTRAISRAVVTRTADQRHSER